jgi:peptide/nickel transport system substrate-binding protein
MRIKRTFLFIIIILAGGILAACSGKGLFTTPATPTPEPTATATPIPQRLLTICLGQEPSSLYLYNGNGHAMWSVLEAIYDGPIDTRGYKPYAVILDKLPSLADGDASAQPMPVQTGDMVVDTDGIVVPLEKGVTVYPTGCSDSSCAVTWDGTASLSMDRMIATFRLKPGVKWSDGEPLTAADSVFSYNIAASPDTPVVKQSTDLTDTYEAVDERTVRWISKPGLPVKDFSQFFWTPLPEHQLEKKTAAELLTAAETNQNPIGWGPYKIDEWVKGDHIRLVKNPDYFRASEGLPKFDVLVFRFLGDIADNNVAAQLTGVCDIVDQTTRLEEQTQIIRDAELKNKIKVYSGLGPEWEHLAIGIKPASADDGIQISKGDRPDFFGDTRTRQAIAYCLDRDQAIVEAFNNLTKTANSYLPPNHPLYNTDLPDYAYNPETGVKLLDEVGWKDLDNDPATPRTAQGVPNVPDGTPFSVSYITTDSTQHQKAAEVFRNSLAKCGLEVKVTLMMPDQLYAPGPEGVMFGRKFDLAQFAWAVGEVPPCFLYMSNEIPSAANNWLGEKFGGANITGYSNPDFDKACQESLSGGMAVSVLPEAARKAMEILTSELPDIPLLYQPKIAISRPDLCGLAMDISSRSEFWNLENLDFGQNCPAE